MAADDLEKVQLALATFAESIQEWAPGYLRRASARIAGRSIGRYMKRTAFKNVAPRKPDDPIRILTGRLSRSLVSRGRIEDTGGQPEGIMKIQVTKTLVRLIKGSKVPYASVHEHGFRGVVYVRPHKRVHQSGRRHNVRWHARRVVIAKRAYLLPALQDELPTLQDMAESEVTGLIQNAFKI